MYINNVKEVIISNLFVKEPVNEIHKRLKKSDSSKIILIGERGCGKTTVLYNHEFKSIGTENPAIYTRFDSLGMFGENEFSRKSEYKRNFVKHYYELVFAVKILDYISSNYEKTFSEHFKEDKEIVCGYLKKVDDYIRNHRYERMNLNDKLDTGDLTSKYIKKFKKYSDSEDVTLMIDRFDWTDGGSEISQSILKKYFKMFDKSIITTDDQSVLRDEDKRKGLTKKGFSILEVNYGKDVDIVKKIVELRIKHNNSSQLNTTDKITANILTDEVYRRLTTKADGNIDTILMTISSMNDTYSWKKGSIVSNMKECFDEQVEEKQKIKSMSRPVRLY